MLDQFLCFDSYCLVTFPYLYRDEYTENDKYVQEADPYLSKTTWMETHNHPGSISSLSFLEHLSF